MAKAMLMAGEKLHSFDKTCEFTKDTFIYEEIEVNSIGAGAAAEWKESSCMLIPGLDGRPILLCWIEYAWECSGG